MSQVIHDDESAGGPSSIAQGSKESSSRCKVCHAPAMYSNFGVICCSPCKMFFKRNAELEQSRFKCSFDDRCEVNVHNRRMCASCRLRRCFAIGMKIELLRGSRSRKNKKRDKKTTSSTGQLHQQQLPVRNILHCKRTTLTVDEWHILSNVSESIDENEQFNVVKQYLAEQNSLPLKLRFKCSSMDQLMASLIGKARLFFGSHSPFQALCAHDRSILCRRLMKYFVVINFAFIAQKNRLIPCPSFDKILEMFFGSTGMNGNERVASLLDTFGDLLTKLSLTMICLSTFDYVTSETNSPDTLVDVKSLVDVQNMYIGLTWRYLVHRYDERQAVAYFAAFVKCIFAVNESIVRLREEKCFVDTVRSAIEQAEQIFTTLN